MNWTVYNLRHGYLYVTVFIIKIFDEAPLKWKIREPGYTIFTTLF